MSLSKIRSDVVFPLVFAGILIAKKALFKNTAPNGCGGGTVFFVTRDSHRYLQDTELREEGGTAAVVESVRAGLVMQLKETTGVQAIMAREEKISRSGGPHSVYKTKETL
jgi:selenocysteine lyase/cysteine desulfurase